MSNQSAARKTSASVARRVPVAWAIISLLSAASTAGAMNNSPNILLILADDVGGEVLGCYGGSSYSTPQLDRLAASGKRYRHCYSMPTCHPTRTTLLTGRYPFRIGNPRWGTFPRELESRTIAALAKRAGYATAVAGKWQITLLGDDPEHPHRLGFDDYCLFGWHEGPRYFEPHIRQNGTLRRDVAERYGPDVYTEFLIDFIDHHRQGPFFAFYSMALCHDVTNDLDSPPAFGPHGRWQTYTEMVAAMDHQVGRLLTALQHFGLEDDTIVIFTTDNGTPVSYITGVTGNRYEKTPVTSRRHGKDVPGGKGTLSDRGIRIPLLVRWPGHVTPGTVSDDLVDMSDFLPTLAELATVDVPSSWSTDGQSLVASLLDRTGARRQWIFAQHGNRACLRDRDWKLYQDRRLFDMRTSTDESRAIASTTTNRDATEARQRLEQQLDALGWYDTADND